MSKIKIERNPNEKRLEELGISDWPIWTKEVSEFPWSYDAQETCYFLEGDVIVTPDGEEPVNMGKGDLVTFPKGMSCTWNIGKDVRKHYQFGSTTTRIAGGLDFRHRRKDKSTNVLPSLRLSPRAKHAV